MDIELKKKLAEFVGVEIFMNQYGLQVVIDGSIKSGSYSYERYDPANVHKQFAVIWRKLSPIKRQKIRQGWINNKHFDSAILYELPKVMQAVLEILNMKGDKGGD